MSKSLAARMWQYQSERFPLAVLSFTTLAVIGSTWAISHPSDLGRVILVFLITLLFMLHLRIFDEFKDHSHDSLNYPDRPLQRGLVTKKELSVLVIVVIGLELILNLLFNSVHATQFYILVLAYTLLTKKEFFAATWLKPRFFLYNFLHYIQLGIFQIFIYISFAPINHTVVVWHLLLVLTLVLLLEFARKMRPADFDHANDTYSSKLGTVKASRVYIGILFIATIFCGLVLNRLGVTLIWLLLPTIALLLATREALGYAKINDLKHSKMVMIYAIVFYLLSYAAIILGHIL